MFGVRKDVSKFRPFGCRAYMHLKKKQWVRGRHAPKAIKLGFATDCNTSGYTKHLI